LKSTFLSVFKKNIFEIAEKIIVTGIKNSIMEIFGFIRPNVDNTIEEECPIVNKVTIQNNFLKYLNENGIVIDTKNRK
tara:strand:- start:308 stop:541 length:234 start_codon:yes stop_codon:yes gene_type:complete